MLFWQRTCPVAQKSIAKAPNQKDARQPKCFSFFFLFFFFRWASSKLCESFMIVSYKTAVFYIEQCTSPWLFHNFEVSHDHKAVGTGHQTTMASFAMPFSSLVHMRTNHLAAKCNYYPRLLNYIYKYGCVHEDRESLSSIVDSVLTQPNTAYIYWGSLWQQICCSVMDGNFLLKHAPAAKDKC